MRVFRPWTTRPTVSLLKKKDLIVDSYIKWRISDFSRYYLATGGGDVPQAEVLLKRKFSDRLCVLKLVVWM